MQVSRRTWPWLAGAMIIALLAGAYAALAGVGVQIGQLGAVAGNLASAAHPHTSESAGSAEHEQAPAAPLASIMSDTTAPHGDGHRDAGPAMRAIITDPPAWRRRLETLLASDAQTLAEVRALLDEPDPAQLALNLQLLQDSFGTE